MSGAEIAIVHTAEEVRGLEGRLLGPGHWMTVTQAQISAFADVTDDHQWIHEDFERAAAGPFGGTVAHGYLTLSSLPRLGRDLLQVPGARMSMNYGLNKVRFPHPVASNTRIRAHLKVDSVTDVRSGLQVVVVYHVEIENVTKPACVAETVRLVAF